MAILIATLVVGAVGLVVGVLLMGASEKFKVEEDPREVAIRALLPGANCGGCGFPGCDGLAAAITHGEAPVNGCPVGPMRSPRSWAWTLRSANAWWPL